MTAPRPRRTPLASLGVIVALLGGCATYPTAETYRAASAPYPGGGAVPGALDARAEFRRTFCALLEQQDRSSSQADCDAYLWRLKDEAPPAAAARATVASPHRAFIVTGALGDCRLPGLRPFAASALQPSPPPAGRSAEIIEVSGRSGTAHNAQQIAAALRAARLGEHERVILIGYSKGATDILQFLVDEPELSARVAAVVSVAGAIQGSPLADSADALYDAFLAHSFDSLCPAGDGKLVDSLVPQTRRDWLDAHPLPAHVRYFSLAAFTTKENLSRALRQSWVWLARSSAFNDGQVLAVDAVIPGSILLGYANADHWDVAIAVEEALPHLAGRPSARTFPRDTLLQALLAHVDDALAARDAGSQAPDSSR